jgi:hypothetical protein
MKYQRIITFFLFFPAIAMDDGDSMVSNKNIDLIFSLPTLKKLMTVIRAKPELAAHEFTNQCIVDKLKEFEAVKKELQPAIYDFGIDLDLVNGDDGINARIKKTGATALSLLMFLEEPNVELVEKMLKNSADPNVRDIHGDISLRYMLINLQHESDPLKQEKCKKIIELLLTYQANPEIENEYGITPFSSLVNLKVSHGLIEIAELFIRFGVNINRINSNGTTLLIDAIGSYIARLENYKKNIITRRPSLAFIKFLLDHGARPNMPNQKGISPIAFVISCETSMHADRLLNLLLRKGATLTITKDATNT